MYLIKDAIHDGNVLGFSVEYVKTFDGNIDESDDQKVKAIDTEEVFMNEERLTLVANHIISHHAAKTRNGQYTAIFTVQNISMLIAYYHCFKQIKHDLKIAGIFTFSANEDAEGNEEHSRDALERMIQDYNLMFDSNFSTDTFSNYFTDVSKKVKSAQIDILLVVNMFLTGFDSRTLNTLYVDKNLKYHDLVQAFSRTNRVEKATKPYGNIVCYRNLKKNTDDAMRLFSKTDQMDTVLMQSYDVYLAMWQKQCQSLLAYVKQPKDVDNLITEEEKEKFILLFRELGKVLIKLRTFLDFEFTEAHLGMSEQMYQDFQSKYMLIYEQVNRKTDEKVSILSDIDFSIEIMHSDKINVTYIMNLIRDIDLTDEKKKARDIRNILEELERADQEELRLKVDLLKQFLTKVVPQMSPDACIEEQFDAYVEEQKQNEIIYFANDLKLRKELIQESIEEYAYSGLINQNQLRETVRSERKTDLKTRKNIVNQIKDFIYTVDKKYN